MKLSARELIAAREITAELLEQLSLDAYVFEVEPRDGPWELHLECAQGGGWQTISIDVSREQLLASRSNEADRATLLEDWRQHLSECRRAPPGD